MFLKTIVGVAFIVFLSGEATGAPFMRKIGEGGKQGQRQPRTGFRSRGSPSQGYINGPGKNVEAERNPYAIINEARKSQFGQINAGASSMGRRPEDDGFQPPFSLPNANDGDEAFPFGSAPKRPMGSSMGFNRPREIAHPWRSNTPTTGMKRSYSNPGVPAPLPGGGDSDEY